MSQCFYDSDEGEFVDFETLAEWESRDKSQRDRIEALEAALDEMTRRRDEWRKKAEGFDAVRLALREKVGAPWPPNMSRLLWAGIAADEKKRADDAEADASRLWEALNELRPLVFGANHAEERYPLALRALGRTGNDR